VGLEEFEIFGIGLPARIHKVAHHRHGAHDQVEAQVGEHAQEGFFGQAKAQAFGDDVDRGDSADHVAAAGQQAEDGVEADAVGGAGDGDGVVKDVGDDLNAFEGRGVVGAHGGKSQMDRQQHSIVGEGPIGRLRHYMVLQVCSIIGRMAEFRYLLMRLKLNHLILVSPMLLHR
jgi:hypothetical protein